MTEQDPVGVRLMREHEARCELDTRDREPRLAAVLQETVDCIVMSTHAFEGLENLKDEEQALLAQVILGARTARVFVALTLTGQYESATAVGRTLLEDGIACAYLIEHPEHAARWRRSAIELKYGDMAKAVIEAHAARDDEETPGEGDAWRRGGEVLRQMRVILDDLSHANPARTSFVLKAHGYELYPWFDRDALRFACWVGLLGLAQLLFFSRKLLGIYGKVVPVCNSDELRERLVAEADILEQANATPDGQATP